MACNARTLCGRETLEPAAEAAAWAWAVRFCANLGNSSLRGGKQSNTMSPLTREAGGVRLTGPRANDCVSPTDCEARYCVARATPAMIGSMRKETVRDPIRNCGVPGIPDGRGYPCRHPCPGCREPCSVLSSQKRAVDTQAMAWERLRPMRAVSSKDRASVLACGSSCPFRVAMALARPVIEFAEVRLSVPRIALRFLTNGAVLPNTRA